jgi:hypothetical protein
MYDETGLWRVGGLPAPWSVAWCRFVSLRRSQSESRMREIRTSGLMSGVGKRDGVYVSTRGQPRLYLRFSVRDGPSNYDATFRSDLGGLRIEDLLRAVVTCPAEAVVHLATAAYSKKCPSQDRNTKTVPG